MSLKNLFLIFLVSSLALSCAHKTSRKDEGLSVVDFKQDGPEEDITISEKVSTDYGPAPVGDGQESAVEANSDEQQQVIALDLYPSLYNSLGFISLFSELEHENIKVSIITSQGFSAVFGALYSKYESASMLEWKSFALYQALGDSDPFSEDWSERLKEFLTEEFGDQKIGQLKKLFFIPKQVGNKFIFKSDQKVVDALMAAVDLRGKSNALTSANLNYLGKLRDYGADLVYRVSFLPERITLKSPNGFVFGLYSKLGGKAKGEYIFSKALKGDIDAFKNLSDSVYQTKETSKKFAQELREELDKDSGKN